MMIEVEITDKILKRASSRADSQRLNTYSFTTHGKLYGILAEELFLSKYKEAVLKNTKHYDVEYPGVGKIDIKAKSCKSKPLANYTASVSDYQKKHKSEAYIFYRIGKDLKTAWELGGMEKVAFFDKATFVPVGTRDGPFVCKVDMWSLAIDKLIPLNKFLKLDK